MAQQQRKPVKSIPVTSHPLFPAVAGLWCGAALGLGSLAVRATLLESLVLKSHIDLIVPATAPPLGVTARILLALLLAAVGGVIGVVLARRLARPKVVETERKRGAKDLSAKPFHIRARDAHPDAPARAPISAHEELGSTGNAPSILTSRRRALAIVHDENDFVPQDFAPLPGGAPQILDIAGIGMTGAEPQAAGALDLGTYAQPPAGIAVPSPAPLNWASAVPASAPVQPAELPAALAAQRQVFHADHADPAAAPLPSLASEAAHADGRQVFGMTPQPDRADEPRQIFGIAAIGDHVPQEFVQAAGYQTTVFDGPEPSPLFAPRTEVAAVADVADAVAVAPLDLVEPANVTEPAAPLPSPASLGMTDLAARLADAMASRRRRAVAAVAQPQLAAELGPEFAPEPALELTEAAPIPAAYEPAAYEPAAAPAPAEFVVPAAVVPAFTVPDYQVAEQAPLVEPAPAAAVPLARLPSAMRPLALDAFLEQGAELDPLQLPPRHIAMPAPVAAAVPAPPPAAAFVSDDDPAEDEVQENYGSLLEIAPARAAFVRIDDPAAAEQAHEPVVIFPGQAPRPAAPAAAAGALDPTEADGSFRRFDAPSSAGQGQPLAAANNGLSAVDPAEAERALRAALSNLQRMSGAA